MDTSRKSRIDQWVEDALYKLLEEAMTKRQITSADAAALTPLIQMYQAIQLGNMHDELESLWRLLADGEVGIYISSIGGGGIDVNIREKPQAGPSQPKKGR